MEAVSQATTLAVLRRLTNTSGKKNAPPNPSRTITRTFEEAQAVDGDEADTVRQNVLHGL